MRLAQKSVCGGRRTGQGCQKPRGSRGPSPKVILWLNDRVTQSWGLKRISKSLCPVISFWR